MLWCAVKCCDMLWCAVRCCDVMWCVVSCCDVLGCDVMYSTSLFLFFFFFAGAKNIFLSVDEVGGGVSIVICTSKQIE